MSAKIPIIDFSLFTSGNPTQRLQISQSVVSACKTFGFVYLTNHSIPHPQITTAFSFSQKLFSLPDDQKLLAPHPPGFSIHRGYSHPGLEKVSNLTSGVDAEQDVLTARQVPDYKESYEIGSENYPEQPNVWLPEEVLPGYKQFMTEFYWTLAEFSKDILRALALGIGLEDEEYLQEFYTGDHNQLRLLHYPEVRAEVLEKGRMVRIPAHCDWSAFTLLFQDATGGLEVESPEQPGTFIPVDPIPFACLLNIGDLMARWSNDYLKSTSHRVGLPPLADKYYYTDPAGDEAGEKVRMTKERYSIPYFVTTTPESKIECLPSGLCVNEERPARYPAVTQREYNIMKASMQY